MNKKYKKIIAYVIAMLFMVAIFVPSITAAVDAEEQTQSTIISKIGEVSSKEEVVYGTLDANGKPQGIYIINILEVIASGEITDYGVYKDIKNLTTIHDIEYKDQTITAYSDIGKFYYQGNMEDVELPWDIGIKYYLDGKKISVQELAGQSGKLKMELTTHKTPIANESFYENFMLQISITLDTEKTKNIRAEDAMFANSGQDKLVTFTTLPNTEESMRLYADINDFTMEGVSISAVPFSIDIDLPDTEGIEDDLTTLSGAISALSRASIQLKNGASELAIGARTLQKGSSEYKSGIERLDNESSQLITGSSEINEALSTIGDLLESDMDLSGLEGLEGLEELKELLSNLADMKVDIGKITQELEGLNEAYIEFNNAIESIPSEEVDFEIIEDLFGDDNNDTYKLLKEYYDSARSTKKAYVGFKHSFESILLELKEVIKLFDSIGDVLKKFPIGQDNPLIGLDIQEVFESIRELSSGLGDLASGYNEFHEGLIAYTGGVSDLASGYGGIHSGISGISDGADGLADGTKELSKGMNMLNNKTKDMPDLVSDMMDELMGDFDTSDYVPTSFVSDKNKNVKAVQFVLTTEAIEKEKQVDIDEPVKEETFWDRLMNLFKIFQ